MFLSIGSESLQFDNASIFVQFSVTFIMCFEIILNFFTPYLRDFPWLCNFLKRHGSQPVEL